MNTNTEILTKAYDAGVTEEWERLESVSGKIEFETIKHYINLYAGENSVVYDIGCGPGRYAEYLLEKNCRVAAIDLSQNHSMHSGIELMATTAKISSSAVAAV
jgi:SAM-dependent methyltransferase